MAGGAVGGLCGGVAMLINARLLRSDQPAWARYGLGVLVFLGAAIVWLLLAAVVGALIGLPGHGSPA